MTKSKLSSHNCNFGDDTLGIVMGQLESCNFKKFLYLADFKFIWAKNLLELKEALILSK